MSIYKSDSFRFGYWDRKMGLDMNTCVFWSKDDLFASFNPQHGACDPNRRKKNIIWCRTSSTVAYLSQDVSYRCSAFLMQTIMNRIMTA